MKVVELNEEHLRSIELREIDRVDLGDNLSQDQIKYYMSSEYKKAILVGDKVAMIAGAKKNKKDCRTWLLASSLIHKYPVTAMKRIMGIELDIMDKLHPEFFYTFNLPAFPDAIKFLKRLGYSESGTTNKFEDGKERIILMKEAIYG